MSFEQEIATYHRHKPLMMQNLGKYVFIKGDTIEGIYDTVGEAARAAYHRYGRQGHFMIDEITEEYPPVIKLHGWPFCLL